MGWAKKGHMVDPGINIVISRDTKKIYVGTYTGNWSIGSQDKALGIGDIKSTQKLILLKMVHSTRTIGIALPNFL